MSIASANKTTDESTRRAILALQNAVRKIQDESIPFALEAVGKRAEEHARATHTYQNRTGALEASTTFAIVNPRSTGSFVYEDKKNGGRGDMPVENPDDQILLVIGAGQPYGQYPELLHGYDVVIQTFLMLRREFKKLFGEALKSRRISP